VFIYLQINGYLALRSIKDLRERGLIRMVSIHCSQQIPKYKKITPPPSYLSASGYLLVLTSFP